MLLARRHLLVLEFALLALVTYLAALGVSEGIRLAVDDARVAPAEPATHAAEHAPAPLADYAIIADRDIFNPARVAATGQAGSLRLWGVGFAGREARAVIEDTEARQQDLYRVGDRVRGARVAAIDWDRVTLDGPGGEQVLELSPPATDAPSPEPAAPATVASADRIRRTSENVWTVDRRELDGALDGTAGLMTQLRAVAEVRDGRPAGFRLFQIRNDSLFARLGLRDGDVVQRVNGRQIAEPAALLGFLDRLKHEPRVALDIVRADAPRTLVYDLR
jgi:general secretion pathway protein C